MMEFVDRHPDVNVAPIEYLRLLGYPRGVELSGRAAELAEWACEWYRSHGRPWLYTREAASLRAPDGAVEIEGVSFSDKSLRQARGAILVAVGAGAELEQEVERLWESERPDEYFFLDIFGSAVVEHLMARAARQLREWAESRQIAVLPHRSPGYAGWDIGEQARLLELLRPGLPYPMESLDSGALRPRKSQLAVFGLTAADSARRLTDDGVPCETCSLAGCQFRRPVRNYNVRLKALERWAAERLTLERRQDGSVLALFRYDGTTCSNMGQPLAFQYRVELGPCESGYVIRSQHCAPAPDDTGHVHMCEYLKSGPALIDVIGTDKPLAGQPLDAVLAWPRATTGAGCYCDAASREHKWGLVLETIHYALAKTG